jgi:hypothetical protein
MEIAAGPGAVRAHPCAVDWPARPVRYIELGGPGSTADVASRAWCGAMAEISVQRPTSVGTGHRMRRTLRDLNYLPPRPVLGGRTRRLAYSPF